MLNLKKSVFLGAAALLLGTVSNAQDTKYGDTPEIQEKCKQKLSLYREYRDQKLYDDAITHWRVAYNICPKSAKTLYTDGVDFYEYKHKNAAKEQKTAYADSIFMVYDQRIANFGEEGKVLGMKGVAMFKYANDRSEEIYAILKKSIELRKEKSGPSTIDVYFRTMLKLLAEEKVTKAEMLEEYLVLSDYLSAGLEKNPKYEKVYQGAKDNLDELFVKIAACEDIVGIAKERYDAAPDDLENLKKLSKILEKRSCTDSEVFANVANKLYAKEPSHQSAYALGIYYLKQGSASKALGFFKEAIDMCGDCPEKEDYLLAASSAAVSAGQASTAANYARKVLQVNPNSGKAYMIIADAIAASKCGDNEFTRKAPYYLAVDYLIKAKSVDSEVASAANQKIAAYKARFPDKKMLFQYSMIDGSGNVKSDPITIGCWVNETTKARL